MKLQGTIVIPDAKLTQYLLVSRPEDDKAKFRLSRLIAVPGRIRYALSWESIEVNRLAQLTCTSCE